MVAARPTAEPQALGDAFDAMGRCQRRDLLAFADAAGAHTSGCTMSIALRTMASRKPQRVNSFRRRPPPCRAHGTPRHNRRYLLARSAPRTIRCRALPAFAEPDRRRHGKTMIGVDHQLDVGPDSVAHRLNALEVTLDRAEPDLHLDRLETFLDVASGFLDGFVDQPVHVGEIQAGGVAIDLGAEGAADQLVDRLVAGLADDVPQRDVDTADRGDRHALGAVILDPVVEIFPDHLDVERIAPDHAGCELAVDEGFRHGRGPVAFAQPTMPSSVSISTRQVPRVL